ncbi:MAG: hypothetical protein R3C45_11785 [Phycisphaerales bacterium]
MGIEDLNIVLSNWNATFSELLITIDNPQDFRADANFDNFVGIQDLNLVLGNWNAGTPPEQSVSVPEPAAGLLLLMSLWLVGDRHIAYNKSGDLG